jgi:hypothetical protein
MLRKLLSSFATSSFPRKAQLHEVSFRLILTGNRPEGRNKKGQASGFSETSLTTHQMTSCYSPENSNPTCTSITRLFVVLFNGDVCSSELRVKEWMRDPRKRPLPSCGNYIRSCLESLWKSTQNRSWNHHCPSGVTNQAPDHTGKK